MSAGVRTEQQRPRVRRRRLTRGLAGLVLALALAAPSTALAEGGDNAAVAVNTKDGSSIFKLAFDVRRVMGDVVDQTNLAVAYSSCEGCQTVAIAIQVLIVAGDPEVVTPQNVAIALNEMCTTCTTLALAYQFVFGGDKTYLTWEGRRQINRIRRAFYRLRRSGLEPLEIAQEADRLAQELRQVLMTQLTTEPPRGRDRDDDDREDGEDRRSPYEDEPAAGTDTVEEEPAPPPPAEDPYAAPEEEPPSTTGEEPAPAPEPPAEGAPAP